MYEILVCDDEKDIVSALKIYLESENYEVHCAYNGSDALAILEQTSIDLVLLDLMMPGMNGIEALSELRKTKNVPVIILSAKSEDTDKVLGLNVGADDYITKPFNPIELLARVRSQLRRYRMLGAATNPQETLQIGGIELDDRKKQVTLDGDLVNLTKKEYEILKLLMARPSEVMSPTEIYRSIWKDAPYGSENTVAVHIRHIREKIEYNPAEPRHLMSVWGQGYKIEKE